MDKNKKNSNEDINVELGGIGIYGTTSNEEIAGYRTSGNIENAGQIDKGFERPKEEPRAVASLKDKHENEEYRARWGGSGAL